MRGGSVVSLLLALLCCAATEESKFEKIISFAQDLGNGKVVLDLPDEALEGVVEKLTELYIHTPPRYFAGAKDALSPSVTDALTRYAILLEPGWDNGQCMEVCQATSTRLPPVEDLWRRLFVREKFKPETAAGANLILVNWANWFLDELFRTEPHTNGTFFRKVPNAQYEGNQGKHTVTLSQLYGTDSSREAALRTFKGGKLVVRDTPSADGRESLPSITQIRSGSSDDAKEFTILCGWDKADTSCWSNPDYYATGHERFNFHPGHLFLNTIFLREHNRVADELAKHNPSWDDQRLYHTARVLLTHVEARTILEEYVSAGIAGSRNVTRFKYDPDVLRNFVYSTLKPHMYLEFNHLYRWHGLIPDDIDFGGKDKESFGSFLWHPEKFEKRGIPSLASAFHRTAIGLLGPRNTPYYLRNITMQTILDERAHQLRSFNDYREYFGLERYTRFEDFLNDENVTTALKELYTSVDEVDFFVGLMVENRYEKFNFLPQTVLYTVSAFAFSALMNSNVVRDPHLFSVKGLSAWGLEYAKKTTLSDLLKRHADQEYRCSPMIRDEMAFCETIETATEWRLDNVFDYIAQDDIVDSFFDSGNFFDIFTNLLYLILSLFSFFFLIHYGLLFFWKPYKKMDSFEKYRITFASVNIIVLSATTIPYTYYVIEMLFGPIYFESIKSNYDFLFICFLSHGMLYLVEVCSRLIYASTSWMLLFHHTMWFVMILVAAVTRSIFIFKVDFILDLCVSYEAGLFVALLARKITNNYKVRSRLILFGCAYYFLTRALQAMLLVYLFAGSGARMLTGGDAVNIFVYFFSLIGSTALVFMQLHTFIIFFILYNSDKALMNKQGDDEIPELDSVTDTSSEQQALESTPQLRRQPQEQHNSTPAPVPSVPMPSISLQSSPSKPSLPIITSPAAQPSQPPQPSPPSQDSDESLKGVTPTPGITVASSKVPLLVIPPKIHQQPPATHNPVSPRLNAGHVANSRQQRRSQRLSVNGLAPVSPRNGFTSPRLSVQLTSPRNNPAPTPRGVTGFLTQALSGYEIEDDGVSPFSFSLFRRNEADCDPTEGADTS